MQKITIHLQKEDWEKLIDLAVVEMRPANMQAEYIVINAVRKYFASASSKKKTAKPPKSKAETPKEN